MTEVGSASATYPLIAKYLDSTTASGLYEARLGGPTCLAGDVIGDYSFPRRLKPGDEIVFGDMAIYTMVKNNTFNGMPLPSIALRKKTGRIVLLREFGYADFKRRLG